VPTPTITWNDGAIGPLRTDLPQGTYTATIVGTNGSIAMETVVIAPTVSLSTVVSDMTCPGANDGAIGIVVVGTQGPATATWSDGASGLERIELVPGTYSVTVTSAEGCVFTETFTVGTILPSPMPVIEAQAGTLTVVGTYEEYQWLLNGMPIDGATQSSYVVLEDGTYTLTVVDVYGCKGTSNAINVELNAASSIPTLKSVQVTPNPFSSQIRLELTASETLSLELTIIDLQGKTMLTDKLSITSTTIRDYDLGQIPSGTYLLVLKNGKGEWVEQLIKL